MIRGKNLSGYRVDWRRGVVHGYMLPICYLIALGQPEKNAVNESGGT